MKCFVISTKNKIWHSEAHFIYYIFFLIWLMVPSIPCVHKYQALRMKMHLCIFKNCTGNASRKCTYKLSLNPGETGIITCLLYFQYSSFLKRKLKKKKKKSASAHEACSALLYMHITPRAPFTLWHLVESGKAQPERLPSPSWPLTVMVPECLKRRKACRYLLHLSSLHDRCHSSRWH